MQFRNIDDLILDVEVKFSSCTKKKKIKNIHDSAYSYFKFNFNMFNVQEYGKTSIIINVPDNDAH